VPLTKSFIISVSFWHGILVEQCSNPHQNDGRIYSYQTKRVAELYDRRARNL